MHTGAGSFASGSRQRYSFVHVFESPARKAVTRRPSHHALVAEGYLGASVLGRLPGSATLNYARLVPTEWLARGEAKRYEVLLYRLDGKRLVRARTARGKPLGYILERAGLEAPWGIELTESTPVAAALDSTLTQSGATAPFEPATHP
jgi:hypothetical protein